MNEHCWPRIGVGAVVLDGNRIVLVKRRYPPFENKWSIPGGHLKPGETIVEAGLRELREETSIEGRALGIIDVHELIMTGGERRVDRHYLLVDILVEPITKNPQPGSDALEASWFTLQEALQLDLTPSSRKLIEKIARQPIEDLLVFSTTITKCTNNKCT